MVMEIPEKENLDNPSAACLRSEDSLAQAILTKPDLLKHLCDPEVMEKVAEAHPCLLEAANNLTAAVHEERQSSARSSAAPESETSGSSYYLDKMSDDEMDSSPRLLSWPPASEEVQGAANPSKVSQGWE